MITKNSAPAPGKSEQAESALRPFIPSIIGAALTANLLLGLLFSSHWAHALLFMLWSLSTGIITLLLFAWACFCAKRRAPLRLKRAFIYAGCAALLGALLLLSFAVTR